MRRGSCRRRRRRGCAAPARFASNRAPSPRQRVVAVEGAAIAARSAVRTPPLDQLDARITGDLPDGRRAVSVSGDETLRVWDLETGDELEVVRGHEGPILGVAVSADGRQAASAGLDGTIRLWDLENGAGLAVLEGHEDPVWSLRYTPDGRRLVSAGADEVLRVWDLASAREIANGVDGLAHAAEWDDGSRGAELFRKCSACHTLGEDGGNRAGPTLYGLFGRRFGEVAGYRYSEALSNSDLVWNETTIDALFAEGPAEYVPGSKMPLQRMPDPEDRAELIAFLKRVTAPQP